MLRYRDLGKRRDQEGSFHLDGLREEGALNKSKTLTINLGEQSLLRNGRLEEDGSTESSMRMIVEKYLKLSPTISITHSRVRLFLTNAFH